MPADSIDQQLVKYLVDAHAIEEQALVQLRRAPQLAGDRVVADVFREHLTETWGHERDVREALSRRGASPAAVKEAVMRAGGLGFVLFARVQPDTPGKLATHAYSYEHLELASYELLGEVAERSGDNDVVALARRIAAQERAMGERLLANFDRTAVASLDGADPARKLPGYLSDAHAIEMQSIALLRRAPRLVRDSELAAVLEEHLRESHEHARLIERRLDALGGKVSAAKDAAMRLGALNWGMFFQAHPDTPGKLAAFAFAFEHLEIGGYEHLRLVAERAADLETVRIVAGILEQERDAAAKIGARFALAAGLSLQAVGV